MFDAIVAFNGGSEFIAYNCQLKTTTPEVVYSHNGFTLLTSSYENKTSYTNGYIYLDQCALFEKIV